jgi:two-component system nitrogen regulation response regulator GlnG
LGTKRRSNVRIIAATTRDLRGLIQRGLFREDLFFRLNVATLRLPPLRDRAEDIQDLARTFLLRAVREGLPAKTIDASAIERLKRHSWPGNVRELENLVRRICALHVEDLITARIVERELIEFKSADAEDSDLETFSQLIERKIGGYFGDDPETSLPSEGLYDHLLDQLERPLFQMALAATRGNQLRAAALLGLNRNTLRKKIESRGVEVVLRRRRTRSDDTTETTLPVVRTIMPSLERVGAPDVQRIAAPNLDVMHRSKPLAMPPARRRNSSMG